MIKGPCLFSALLHHSNTSPPLFWLIMPLKETAHYTVNHGCRGAPSSWLFIWRDASSPHSSLLFDVVIALPVFKSLLWLQQVVLWIDLIYAIGWNSHCKRCCKSWISSHCGANNIGNDFCRDSTASWISFSGKNVLYVNLCFKVT